MKRLISVLIIFGLFVSTSCMALTLDEAKEYKGSNVIILLHYASNLGSDGLIGHCYDIVVQDGRELMIIALQSGKVFRVPLDYIDYIRCTF